MNIGRKPMYIPGGARKYGGLPAEVRLRKSNQPVLFFITWNYRLNTHGCCSALVTFKIKRLTWNGRPFYVKRFVYLAVTGLFLHVTFQWQPV